MRLKTEKLRSATGSLRLKTLWVLAGVYLMASTGCGYAIVKRGDAILPEGRVGESHPTKSGYECYPTGYIQEILKEIDICLEGG